MAHYYDTNPSIESNKKSIEYRFNGINFSFISDTDVFSRNDIDFGTNLLITESVRDIKDNAYKAFSIMDLGCGYGVVGIVMKAIFKKAKVVQVDINARAIGLAKENAKLNGVNIDIVKKSDVLSAIDEEEKGEGFDIVITNPPVRAGKAKVFEFYDQAFESMHEDSVIYVVLQRKQGAPSTQKKLEELFGNCETVAVDSGYRVMKSVKQR